MYPSVCPNPATPFSQLLHYCILKKPTGSMESISTYKSLASLRPTIRPFVLTRAHFAGAGAYAAHWNGRKTPLVINSV